LQRNKTIFFKTANAEVPVIVKTYYDKVDNFKFDQLDNSISFDMPFDWNPDYVSLVPVVHEEITVQKILFLMKKVYSSKVMLMG